jgi:hypothetical protein
MNRLFVALATLSLSLAGNAQAATRCADFQALDDGTTLPSRFKINGFKFTDKAGGAVPVVRAGEDAVGTPFHGLVFDQRSLQITPPKPAGTVRVRLLTRSGAPLQVVAYDAQGGVQASGLCTNENLSEELTFIANDKPISRLEVSGGDDQGLVDQVCTLR